MEKEMHPNAGVTQTKAAQPSSANTLVEPDGTETSKEQITFGGCSASARSNRTGFEQRAALSEDVSTAI